MIAPVLVNAGTSHVLQSPGVLFVKLVSFVCFCQRFGR